MTLSSILAEDAVPVAGGLQPMNFILFALFALVIVMMFRKQKKAKAAAQEKAAKLAPGVDIMTNFGLFGHVVSVDPDNNKLALEVAPGVVVDVHSQTVAKIIEPTPAAEDELAATVPDDASSLSVSLDKSETAAETPDETLARLNKDNNKDH